MGNWLTRAVSRGYNSNPQDNGSSTIASVQVDKRGGVYISSQRISELPEVQEMRRLAAEVVEQDLATVRR